MNFLNSLRKSIVVFIEGGAEWDLDVTQTMSCFEKVPKQEINVDLPYFAIVRCTEQPHTNLEQLGGGHETFEVEMMVRSQENVMAVAEGIRDPDWEKVKYAEALQALLTPSTRIPIFEYEEPTGDPSDSAIGNIYVKVGPRMMSIDERRDLSQNEVRLLMTVSR